MKNITQTLSNEHQNILKVINLFLTECDEITDGKELNKDYFNKVVDFIKNYADTYHHAKEENILFKIMLDNTENLHCNPIPVMLDEHDAGRNYVSSMVEGLASSNTEMVLENARGFGNLLQQHIYKEDNILYPMAEQSLSEEQKEKVQQMYDDVELKDNNNLELLKYFGL